MAGIDLDVAALAVRAAEEGAPLAHLLDEVERVHVDRSATSLLEAVRLAAETWAERAAWNAWDQGCHDAVTTLASVPHLRSRIADVQRAAARDGHVDTHVLVVVELVPPTHHGLAGALMALDVGVALRSVFAGEETLVRLGASRYAVLVEAGRADPLVLHTVVLVLAELVADPRLPQVWVEPLPAGDGAIADLLARVVAGWRSCVGDTRRHGPRRT